MEVQKMFEEIFRNYQNHLRSSSVWEKAPKKEREMFIYMVVVAVLYAIASIVGNSILEVVTAVAMLPSFIYIFKTAKEEKNIDNTIKKIQAKKEELQNWSLYVNENGMESFNNSKSFDMLIECVDERMKIESFKVENRPGLLIGSLILTIIIPTVINIISKLNLGNIGWSTSIKLVFYIALAVIEVFLLIVVAYPLYTGFVSKNYNDLYNMKNDLLYLKYLCC